MCLGQAVRDPRCVLGQGKHAGHEWVVVHNGLQFRCGYVKVEPGHPWHGMDIPEIYSLGDVHGGLTFAEADEPCDADGPDDGWWLGFDCMHLGDMLDKSLPRTKDPVLMMISHYKEGAIRDQEYVEGECRRLCENARDAARDKECGETITDKCVSLLDSKGK
jgi:hypothetical protein